MAEFILQPALAALPNLTHGFFTRRGGVSTGVYDSLNNGWSSGDTRENVTENRRRIAAQLGVAPTHLLSLHQTHSAIVHHITTPFLPDHRPLGDAMVTATRGVALGILTADCVPVLLADPVAGVIGAAHAGWRGAVAGILSDTVTAMLTLGAARARIVAALGPCIWQASYEVGAEVRTAFAVHPELPVDNFFRASNAPDKYYLDLPGWVCASLALAGIGLVAPSLADTYPDTARFFSYRRTTHTGGGKTGSLMSAICLT